jgi:hypothetical protein
MGRFLITSGKTIPFFNHAPNAKKSTGRAAILSAVWKKSEKFLTEYTIFIKTDSFSQDSSI